MALSQITVLSELPRFSGNPKPGEPHFKMETDARNFMRALENYFANNNIVSDEKKLTTLFSQIDPKRGDAMNFRNCYAGKVVSFAAVKRNLLNMYPSFKATEFQHAAKALLETDLKTNMFCGMTSLETLSLAAAEAYLKHTPLTKNNFSETTVVKPARSTIGTQPTTATPSSTATQSTAAQSPAQTVQTPAQTVATSATATVATAAQTAMSAESQARPILLLDVLQNFLMHVVMATQLTNKVYTQVSTNGPELLSTDVMSETVRAVEKYKLTHPNKKPARSSSDVVWQTSNRPGHSGRSNQRTAQPFKTKTPQKSDSTTQSRLQPTNNRSSKSELKCYNCNGKGHTRKECRTCSYCKTYGHTAKKCSERMAAAKGKYCHECKLSDSHNTNECFKTTKTTRGRRNENVRLVHEDAGEYASDQDAWPSGIYDESESTSSSDAGY